MRESESNKTVPFVPNLSMDANIPEGKGIRDLIDPHHDKEYFEKLQKIKPDLDLMDYNVLKVAVWRAFSTVISDDAKIGTSEYRDTFRNYVEAKNYKRTKNEYVCTQGNPITIVDQDMSRLPKIVDED